MKDKKKLKKLQKKYNDLLVEHELTKGHFEDFVECSAQANKGLFGKIERLTYSIIFKDHAIGILKSRICKLERGKP